jgi:glutaredoxin
MDLRAPKVVLYSAPGCSLCDEMKAQLTAAQAGVPFELREVDISGDAGLELSFRSEIPVLFVEGRKVAKYRITSEALLRALQAFR